MRCVSVYTHIYIHIIYIYIYIYIYITCTYIAGADVLSVRQDIPLVAVVPWRYLPGGSSARPARRLCLDIWSSPKTTNLFRWNELLQDSIYLCVSLYMILVPGPVAPPQCYGPLLPDLESFISIVLTAFLDAKPRISMVFAPVWMENLIFPWYVQHLDAKPTYIGTKEYSYITSFYIYTHTHIYIYTYIHLYIYTFIHVYMYTCIHVYIYTYIHIYIYTYIFTYIYTYIQPWLPILPTGPHPQGGGGNHDRGGETTYRKYQMPHPQGEGGTMTMGGRRVSPNLEHIYIYYIYI